MLVRIIVSCGEFLADAEVSELDYIIASLHQEVGRLQISMNDTFTVDSFESEANLKKEAPHLCFPKLNSPTRCNVLWRISGKIEHADLVGYSLGAGQILFKVAPVAILHYQIERFTSRCE